MGGSLAVVALLATLLVIKLASSSAGAHGDSSPTPAPSATSTAPTPPPVLGAEVVDLVLAGDREWKLTGRALSLLRDGQTVRSVGLDFLQLPTSSAPLLAVDQSRDIVWLVVANAVPTRIIQFDSRSLRPIETLTWKQVVYGAAAFDGYLFLANDLGLAEVTMSSMRPHFVPGMRGAIGPIAADLVHHQLIALDESDPMAVWRYRHGQRPLEAPTRIPLGMGSLAVTDGQIWVGGYGPRGAMLYRLDPRTLRPVWDVSLPEFDPGAALIAAGRHVIWVRAEDRSSDLFACLDAVTGRIEQRFHLSGVDRVASTTRVGVVATGQGVLPLTMGDCAG